MGETQKAKFAALLILFGLSLFALAAFCFSIILAAPLKLLSLSSLLTAITLLVFWLVSIGFSQSNDADSVCWEVLHQGLMALRQTIREQDEAKAKNLYEQGRGAFGLAWGTEPSCPQLRRLLEQLSSHGGRSEGDWRVDVHYEIGALSALSPFAVPSIRLAIWTQALWQIWMVVASIIVAFVAWWAVTQLPLRALIYAVSGGVLGASLYNLRTLADHIAVQRDYSARFWVDYLTRPILGGVLGVVVYAFAVGLAWTLTFQSPAGAQMPKFVFALGFLSGYALRSVLTWLNGVSKTIFRPAPSPSQEQSSRLEE